MASWEQASYRPLTYPADEAVAAEVFNGLNLSPRSVLDVGCGEGYAERHLLPLGVKRKLKRLEGLDTNEESLGNYQGTANLTKGDMLAMPYDDDSFDLVISSSGIDACL